MGRMAVTTPVCDCATGGRTNLKSPIQQGDLSEAHGVTERLIRIATSSGSDGERAASSRPTVRIGGQQSKSKVQLGPRFTGCVLRASVGVLTLIKTEFSIVLLSVC